MHSLNSTVHVFLAYCRLSNGTLWLQIQLIVLEEVNGDDTVA